MKIIYLSFIFLSLYTHIHAMDLEADQAKIQEYNDARYRYKNALYTINILHLKQRLSQNGNDIITLDPDYNAAKSKLSIAKSDLTKARQWMVDHGYPVTE